MKIEYWELHRLKPYENNPRINQKAVDPVAKSIEKFGFQQPIVVDKNGVIIVGHTRLKAAQKLKLKSVPVLVADQLSEEQARAYRLADNKTGEFALWDQEPLNFELENLENEFSWDMSEFGFFPEQEDQDEEDPKTPPPFRREPIIPDLYQVVVECSGEEEQKQLYEKFTEEGLKCRLLNL
ncbi:MAG: ParB N-terminal domain-containing protein [Planctomycetia bacterium]|nr:ParB N-terminal domain-containing protein [Planctomycetia bacterium]